MTSIKKTLRLVAISTVMSLIYCASAYSIEENQLFQLEQTDIDSPINTAAAAASSGLAEILAAPATASVRLATATPLLVNDQQDEIALPIDDGHVLHFKKFTAETDVDGVSIWRGQISSDETDEEHASDAANQAILVRNGENITGSFHHEGQLYQIWPLKNGRHAIVKVDVSKLDQADDAVEHQAEHAEHGSADNTQQDQQERQFQQILAEAGDGMHTQFVDGSDSIKLKSAHSTIRVMVVTTNQSRAKAKDLQAVIKLAFAEANQGAKNSGVAITFEYAGTFDASYDEKGKYTNMLSQLKNTNDPVLGAPVHGFRESHRADVVVMLATSNTSAGTGYVNASKATAFSVVDYSYATGYYSFAHEIGHNLGLSHDLDQFGGVPTRTPEYQHGYKHTAGTGGGRWRTIMAYNCSPSCARLNYFSNPDILYKGAEMGTQRYENNARRLDERREVVANFYPPLVDITPPVNPPQAVVGRNINAVSTTSTGFAYKLEGSKSLYATHYKWEKLSGPFSLRYADRADADAIVGKDQIGEGTYALTVTNQHGEQSRATINVSVVEQKASITGDSSIIEGQVANLKASANFAGASGAGPTYRWKILNEAGRDILQGAEQQLSLSTLPVGSYDATVEVESTHGGRKATAQHRVDVTKQ